MASTINDVIFGINV